MTAPVVYPYPIYPGFSDLEDWREAVGTDHPQHELRRAKQLVDEAARDHAGKHQRHDHPWCARCYDRCEDWERADAGSEPLPSRQALAQKRAALVEEHNIPGRAYDTVKKLFDTEGMTKESTQQLADALSLPPAAMEALVAYIEDEDNVEYHDVSRQRVTLERAVRYLLLHRNPPKDDYDPEADAQNAYDEEYLDRDGLDDLPEAEPLIDGVLVRHSYALLTGRDHTYKTFTALDWASCLATGKAWQERPVEPVRVLYIIGEGAYGIAKRLDAWEHAWGHEVDPERLTIRRSAVNLFRGGPDFFDLLRRVREGGYGLVVVDTLRRSSGGANSNSDDMGVVVDNIEKLKRATDNGSVLLLAHTGKDDRDTRGFSGIEDDADVIWHAKRDDDEPVMTLKNTKMKDGPDGLEFTLAPLPVLNSLVLQSSDGTERAEDSNQQARHVLAVLRHSFSGQSPTGPELMAATDLPKSTFYRAFGDLKKAGSVVNVGTRKTPRWEPAGSSESQGVWDKQSQPVPTAAPALTSAFPTVPTESQSSPKPVPPVPHPYRGGTGTDGRDNHQTTLEDIA